MLQCQPGQLTRKHLLFSVLAHLVLAFVVSIAASFEGNKKHFIVFGVHSSKHPLAYFKPLLAPKQKIASAVGKLTTKKPTARPIRKKMVTKRPVIKKPVIKELAKNIPKPKPIIKKVQTKPAAVKPVQSKPVQPEPVEIPQETVEEVFDGPLTINLAESIDPKLIKYYRELQKEVAKLWRPPVGVPKGTECILSVEIDREGKVKDFELKEKSKVLIYDMSVLQAAKEFKLSKSFWGNNLLITFRQ